VIVRESRRHFSRDAKFVFRTTCTVTSVEEHLENLGSSEHETIAATNSYLGGSVIFTIFCELIITVILKTIEVLTMAGLNS
jgi:hypothetical protein